MQQEDGAEEQKEQDEERGGVEEEQPDKIREALTEFREKHIQDYPSAPCGASTADPVLLEAFASVYLVSWIACCNM